jgi:hypothetical protein
MKMNTEEIHCENGKAQNLVHRGWFYVNTVTNSVVQEKESVARWYNSSRKITELKVLGQ